MNLIQFGYDKDSEIWQRGYARSDWSLKALEDSRNNGWQICDRYGNRSGYMTKDDALAALQSA
jgi:hypothetical protein